MKRLGLAVLLFALGACDSGGVMAEIEKAEAEKSAVYAAEAERSAKFLEDVAKEEGVVARPSGLLVQFETRAPARVGATAPAGADVVVHYEGRLADGTVFDSSIGGQPAQFSLNEVVPGFSEAIQMMRPGDVIIATFPGALGYGAQGSPPTIPPNAALQFRIALFAYRTPEGRVVTVPQPAQRRN